MALDEEKIKIKELDDSIGRQINIDYLDIAIDWGNRLVVELGGQTPIVQITSITIIAGFVYGPIAYFSNHWPFRRKSDSLPPPNGNGKITPGKLHVHLEDSSPEEIKAIRDVLDNFNRSDLESADEEETIENILQRARG